MKVMRDPTDIRRWVDASGNSMPRRFTLADLVPGDQYVDARGDTYTVTEVTRLPTGHAVIRAVKGR